MGNFSLYTLTLVASRYTATLVALVTSVVCAATAHANQDAPAPGLRAQREPFVQWTAQTEATAKLSVYGVDQIDKSSESGVDEAVEGAEAPDSCSSSADQRQSRAKASSTVRTEPDSLSNVFNVWLT